MSASSNSADPSVDPSVDPWADPWVQLLRQIAHQWPVHRWNDVGVVAGCSGGADSVALVSALASLRQQASDHDSDPPRGFLVVAHFNHHLRGADSDQDQELAERLSRQLGLQWCEGHASSQRSDEASLRTDRMRFLVDTAHTTGARYVALAHSADDNVETVLHHLMRGTGPAGLSGMGSPRPIADDLVLVRPLLHSCRKLIRSALVAQGIPWREDASNQDPVYRRNWIRHQLIPLIQSQYPQAVEAMERAIEGQRQWRRIIDRLADRWLDDHQTSGEPLILRRDGNIEPAIAIAAVQRLWTRCGWPRGAMTQSHWLRLAETLSGGGVQRYSLPSGVEVHALGEEVRLSREARPEVEA